MRFFTLALVFFLQACGYMGPKYTPPVQSFSTATIKGSHIKGEDNNMFSPNYINALLHTVDGLGIKPDFMKNTGHAEHALIAGSHTIAFYLIVDHPNISKCPCYGTGIVVANFKSGKDYQVNGSIKGKTLSLWIEDFKTKEIVSDVVYPALSYQAITVKPKYRPK